MAAQALAVTPTTLPRAPSMASQDVPRRARGPSVPAVMVGIEGTRLVVLRGNSASCKWMAAGRACARP